MKIEFYDCEEIDRETADELWEQGVPLEDYDYCLFILHTFKSEFDEISIDDKIQYVPINFNIGRLLGGSCANNWYPVKNFRGKRGILGVAYHS